MRARWLCLFLAYALSILLPAALWGAFKSLDVARTSSGLLPALLILSPYFLHGLVFGATFPRRAEECLLGLVPSGLVGLLFLTLSILAAATGTGDMRGFGIALILGLWPPIVVNIGLGLAIGRSVGKFSNPRFERAVNALNAASSRVKAATILAVIGIAIYWWVRPLIFSAARSSGADKQTPEEQLQ